MLLLLGRGGGSALFVCMYFKWPKNKAYITVRTCIVHKKLKHIKRLFFVSTVYTYLNFWHQCLIRVMLFSLCILICYLWLASLCGCQMYLAYIYLYVWWHQFVFWCVWVFCLLLFSTCSLTQPILVNCFIVGLSFLIVCVCLVNVMCALLSIPSLRNSTDYSK